MLQRLGELGPRLHARAGGGHLGRRLAHVVVVVGQAVVVVVVEGDHPAEAAAQVRPTPCSRRPASPPPSSSSSSSSKAASARAAPAPRPTEPPRRRCSRRRQQSRRRAVPRRRRGRRPRRRRRILALDPSSSSSTLKLPRATAPHLARGRRAAHGARSASLAMRVCCGRRRRAPASVDSSQSCRRRRGCASLRERSRWERVDWARCRDAPAARRPRAAASHPHLRRRRAATLAAALLAISIDFLPENVVEQLHRTRRRLPASASPLPTALAAASSSASTRPRSRWSTKLAARPSCLFPRFRRCCARTRCRAAPTRPPSRTPSAANPGQFAVQASRRVGRRRATADGANALQQAAPVAIGGRARQVRQPRARRVCDVHGRRDGDVEYERARRPPRACHGAGARRRRRRRRGGGGGRRVLGRLTPRERERERELQCALTLNLARCAILRSDWNVAMVRAARAVVIAAHDGSRRASSSSASAARRSTWARAPRAAPGASAAPPRSRRCCSRRRGPPACRRRRASATRAALRDIAATALRASRMAGGGGGVQPTRANSGRARAIVHVGVGGRRRAMGRRAAAVGFLRAAMFLLRRRAARARLWRRSATAPWTRSTRARALLVADRGRSLGRRDALSAEDGLRPTSAGGGGACPGLSVTKADVGGRRR